MDLNRLHKEANAGNETSRNRLFEHLTVSFRLILQQRLRNREDSEEIAQDALKTVAEKYASLTVQTSFSAWAHKVLEHKLMDFYKSKRVRSVRDIEHRERENPTTGEETDPMLVSRLHDCLKSVFRKNRRYARILALYYQGYSTAEICGKLKITSGNMYMLLSRARASLAACLDGEPIE